MNKRNFHQLLEAKWNEGKMVCVGLDTDYDKIPSHLKKNDIGQSIIDFNQKIIAETFEHVAAFKPNSAFYERYGAEGLWALQETINYANILAPSVPIIDDVKRGDIGNTNDGYVTGVFDWLEADAVTISPYMGKEANQPFLDHVDKGIIILCRTSNPGAGEFQDLPIYVGEPHMKRMFEVVAENIATNWNTNNNCLLVVGATYPQELLNVRRIVGDMGILVPGVGKQGGDIFKVLTNGLNSKNQGLLINSSREVLYASSGTDFAEAARTVVVGMNTQIKQHLDSIK